ncbi:hypothetical protein THASP1DRAFT_23450 [Thamnocephalis sphaerospora]|uniref:Uncharacterized protein n=1 Tax=Thamnocephalis sphaerospora TaxID=78915 RepID=A0A4P9XR89_9FUNG|nr:hypothetical protein THASP1DRAFT_23450 [Thamnocephalis sphaerospora]|eukprot:RKP08586.1 hypothetical protein THASP1DRAFT_23450 [Thamnocephalis sphaerospora]
MPPSLPHQASSTAGGPSTFTALQAAPQHQSSYSHRPRHTAGRPAAHVPLADQTPTGDQHYHLRQSSDPMPRRGSNNAVSAANSDHAVHCSSPSNMAHPCANMEDEDALDIFSAYGSLDDNADSKAECAAATVSGTKTASGPSQPLMLTTMKRRPAHLRLEDTDSEDSPDAELMIRSPLVRISMLRRQQTPQNQPHQQHLSVQPGSHVQTAPLKAGSQRSTARHTILVTAQPPLPSSPTSSLASASANPVDSHPQSPKQSPPPRVPGMPSAHAAGPSTRHVRSPSDSVVLPRRSSLLGHGGVPHRRPRHQEKVYGSAASYPPIDPTARFVMPTVVQVKARSSEALPLRPAAAVTPTASDDVSSATVPHLMLCRPATAPRADGVWHIKANAFGPRSVSSTPFNAPLSAIPESSPYRRTSSSSIAKVPMNSVSNVLLADYAGTEAKTSRVLLQYQMKTKTTDAYHATGSNGNGSAMPGSSGPAELHASMPATPTHPSGPDHSTLANPSNESMPEGHNSIVRELERLADAAVAKHGPQRAASSLSDAPYQHSMANTLSDSASTIDDHDSLSFEDDQLFTAHTLVPMPSSSFDPESRGPSPMLLRKTLATSPSPVFSGNKLMPVSYPAQLATVNLPAGPESGLTRAIPPSTYVVSDQLQAKDVPVVVIEHGQPANNQLLYPNGVSQKAVTGSKEDAKHARTRPVSLALSMVEVQVELPAGPYLMSRDNSAPAHQLKQRPNEGISKKKKRKSRLSVSSAAKKADRVASDEPAMVPATSPVKTPLTSLVPDDFFGIIDRSVPSSPGAPVLPPPPLPSLQKASPPQETLPTGLSSSILAASSPPMPQRRSQQSQPPAAPRIQPMSSYADSAPSPMVLGDNTMPADSTHNVASATPSANQENAADDDVDAATPVFKELSHLPRLGQHGLPMHVRNAQSMDSMMFSRVTSATTHRYSPSIRSSISSMMGGVLPPVVGAKSPLRRNSVTAHSSMQSASSTCSSVINVSGESPLALQMPQLLPLAATKEKPDTHTAKKTGRKQHGPSSSESSLPTVLSLSAHGQSPVRPAQPVEAKQPAAQDVTFPRHTMAPAVHRRPAGAHLPRPMSEAVLASPAYLVAPPCTPYFNALNPAKSPLSTATIINAPPERSSETAWSKKHSVRDEANATILDTSTLFPAGRNIHSVYAVPTTTRKAETLVSHRTLPPPAASHPTVAHQKPVPASESNLSILARRLPPGQFLVKLIISKDHRIVLCAAASAGYEGFRSLVVRKALRAGMSQADIERRLLVLVEDGVLTRVENDDGFKLLVQACRRSNNGDVTSVAVHCI